jgi:hypothetical protein
MRIPLMLALTVAGCSTVHQAQTRPQIETLQADPPRREHANDVADLSFRLVRSNRSDQVEIRVYRVTRLSNGSELGTLIVRCVQGELSGASFEPAAGADGAAAANWLHVHRAGSEIPR